MTAPYEVTASMSDDESFGFTFELKSATDGSLALSDYSFEYELKGCGTTMRLDENSGITIDDANDLIIVEADPDYRLRPGQYRHGFRLRQISSGVTSQLFDGSVTVTQGNF